MSTYQANDPLALGGRFSRPGSGTVVRTARNLRRTQTEAVPPPSAPSSATDDVRNQNLMQQVIELQGLLLTQSTLLQQYQQMYRSALDELKAERQAGRRGLCRRCHGNRAGDGLPASIAPPSQSRGGGRGRNPRPQGIGRTSWPPPPPRSVADLVRTIDSEVPSRYWNTDPPTAAARKEARNAAAARPVSSPQVFATGDVGAALRDTVAATASQAVALTRELQGSPASAADIMTVSAEIMREASKIVSARRDAGLSLSPTTAVGAPALTPGAETPALGATFDTRAFAAETPAPAAKKDDDETPPRSYNRRRRGSSDSDAKPALPPKVEAEEDAPARRTRGRRRSSSDKDEPSSMFPPTLPPKVEAEEDAPARRTRGRRRSSSDKDEPSSMFPPASALPAGGGGLPADMLSGFDDSD